MCLQLYFASYSPGQRASILSKMRSAFPIASAMAHSIPQGFVSGSLSFRAARIVAVNKDCVFPLLFHLESSSGNGDGRITPQFLHFDGSFRENFGKDDSPLPFPILVNLKGDFQNRTKFRALSLW